MSQETFYPKYSNYRGQRTPEELDGYFKSVDMDLENLHSGLFRFHEYDIIRMKNRTGLPSSTAYVGYMCVVSGTAFVCTASGTPGTFTKVGSQ